MPHVDHTRTLRVQLYDASRFHDGTSAELAGELHTVAFSKPAIADDIQKIVDTTAEVLGKRYGVNVFTN
ncbi:hypothetical protein DL738_11820 [Escherichia coli]|uniref:Uncharacterized protein n=1 Tax=Salmonella enterica I TaxID=59201 RepID=A0A379Y1Y7_SALET|nr:hypothetical protein [Salmonella enterica]EGE2353532.1 hypothetical protein [Escherichia coli]SUI39683.1 Uncharacterised protein [Salmonella enterica subsp. enterica]EDC3150214.1 hypothetical protein [Salmonella enterica]EFR0233336.1 hypothetical protein [Salmonella enterica]